MVTRSYRVVFILAGAAAALSLLGGCSTLAGREPGVQPLSATLSAAASVGIDQYHVRLPLTLTLVNRSSGEVVLTAVDSEIRVDGAAAGALSPVVRRSLQSGESLDVPLDFIVDLRGQDGAPRTFPGGSSADWKAGARIGFQTREGARLVSASGEGSFPLVRDPIFRITSLKVERDLLVTTNLRLGLEIENPNAFPLELRSFVYDFYGEGRVWIEEGTDEPVTAAAGSTVGRFLRFTMNFADMDRRLFDLVANLRTLRYRLKGSATIITAMQYLPDFVTRFDREGSCTVER